MNGYNRYFSNYSNWYNCINTDSNSVFNTAIIGAYEVVEYMMAIITSFSVVFTAFEKRHVSVDFFYDILPNKFQLILSTIISFILVLFLVLFSWQNVLFTFETYNQQLTSAILYIPTYPFVAAVSLSFFGTCIVLFVEFLTNISQWWKNEP